MRITISIMCAHVPFLRLGKYIVYSTSLYKYLWALNESHYYLHSPELPEKTAFVPYTICPFPGDSLLCGKSGIALILSELRGFFETMNTNLWPFLMRILFPVRCTRANDNFGFVAGGSIDLLN